MTVSYNYSKIWKVSYPILLTLLVQNIVQVTGTAFLGRVGEVELGASALGGIYYVVIFMLAFGFSTGSQILIGRRNGEGNYHRIGEIMVNGVIFLLIISAVLCAFTIHFSGPILSRLFASENILQATLDYLDWRVFAIFFASINVMFRAFFVGTTHTKILSVGALVLALTNVLFDYLLIFGNWGFPQMGIAGAGLASVIAEAIASLFFIIYTFKRVDLEKYGFKKISFRELRVIKNILNVSVSLMVQNFLSLSTWFLFFIAIEHLGEKSLAISNIVRSTYMFMSIPIFALAATTNTLVSNVIGAGRKEEVMSLVWRIAKMCAAICAVFSVFFFIFPELILLVYTSDTSLINAAVPSMRVMLIVVPIYGISNVFFHSVSGTGNTRTALALEMATLVIYVFYIWLSIIHLQFPLEYCWTCEYVYAAFIFLFSFFYLKKGNWRDKKI
ncbi:MAG: MATE family efflux transporter [Dysgonamonadaceae bacterium]|jgi:putative MATE family efflux protein|nr:MATE family efflux transporter [Dysgonamonadaceae bacterium]